MFKRFDIYLVKIISLVSFNALLFLLGIDLLIQLSGELDNPNYTFLQLILYLAFQLPEKIILFLPAALLIGSIMGLGQLAKENELTVVIAAGINKFRLIAAGIVFAFLLGTFTLIIGELMAPIFQKLQNNLRIELGQNSKQHIWLKDKNYIVNINKFLSNGDIGDIHFFRMDNENIYLGYAKGASFKNNSWKLSDSYLQIINKDNISNQEFTTWENNSSPQILRQLINENSFTSIHQLYQWQQFLKNNGINSKNISLQLWKKIFLPITTCVMLLLALPFIFGSQRNSSQGTRLVFGIILGAVYYLIQTMLANVTLLLSWKPYIAVLAPNVIFASAAILFLRRNNV